MKIRYNNYSTFIFEGFYESGLFNSDSEYYLSENLESPHEIKDFDKFMNSVGKRIANELYYDYFCEEDTAVTDLDFVGIDSPQYYNYSTDRIILDVEVDLKKLEDFCFKDNADDFNKYLSENFTSCDGFHSFVKNNRLGFYLDYKNDESEKERCLNVMLEYYFIKRILSCGEERFKVQMYEIANEELYCQAEPVDNED